MLLLSVGLLGALGCVTKTERIYPHERIPPEESLWEEIRREFGWEKSATGSVRETPSAPFYQRAAQHVSSAFAEWFLEEPDTTTEPLDPKAIAADRRRFEQKRQEALQRLGQDLE